MTIALIDGDLVAYRCAASAEKDEVDIAIIRASRTLQDIVSVTNASDAQIFLSGSRNFRYDLYPEYKANRKDMIRPRHLEAVREFLVLKWGASVTDGYEADDAIGIAMEQHPDSVCCSIDKDLYQLPGLHYHFVNGSFREIDCIEGWQNFYRQILTGDRADNIPGIKGIGKVKSGRVVEGLKTACAMYDAVRKLYNDEQAFIRNGSLIYVWRKEKDLLGWLPTNQEITSEAEHEAVMKLESILTRQAGNFPSTEHGTIKPSKDGSPRRGRSKDSVSRKTSRGH